MSKKVPGALQMELPTSSLLASGGGLTKTTAANLMRSNRQPSKDEEHVREKMRTDLAVQAGYAIKGAHGQHLAQVLTQRSLTQFAEYVEFDRAIMDRDWANADDQADMVAFATANRQALANTHFGIRSGVVNRIEEVAITPLEPPEDKGDNVIIEEKPGLLGAFFGGSKITTVKR